MKIDLLAVEPSKMHSGFERETVLCLVEPPVFVVELLSCPMGLNLSPNDLNLEILALDHR